MSVFSFSLIPSHLLLFYDSFMISSLSGKIADSALKFLASHLPISGVILAFFKFWKRNEVGVFVPFFRRNNNDYCQTSRIFADPASKFGVNVRKPHHMNIVDGPVMTFAVPNSCPRPISRFEGLDCSHEHHVTKKRGKIGEQ